MDNKTFHCFHKVDVFAATCVECEKLNRTFPEGHSGNLAQVTVTKDEDGNITYKGVARSPKPSIIMTPEQEAAYKEKVKQTRERIKNEQKTRD